MDADHERASEKYFQIRSLTGVRADNGGLAILNPGWVHPRRILTSSVLILGLKGTVPLVICGMPVDVIPGRLVLLPTGVEHRGGLPLKEPASYFWLHFTVTSDIHEVGDDEAETILSSDQATSHLLDDSALIPLFIDVAEPEPIKDLFRELLNEQESRSYTGKKFLLMFQMMLIAVTERVIAGHRPRGQASPTTSVVSGVIRQVAENLENPNLSIKLVAGAIGLNLDYVGRRFRQIMGLSVGDYILKQRVKIALSRLQQTGDTIETVALSTGFGSVRHFLRQFKAQTGMTPTEARDVYRRMHVNSM